MSIIIVGNKCDLDDKRQVSYEEGKKFASENGTSFIETSARQKINIIEAFSETSKMVLAKIDSGIIDLTNERHGVKPGNISGIEYSSEKLKKKQQSYQNSSGCCSN